MGDFSLTRDIGWESPGAENISFVAESSNSAEE